MSKNLSLYSSGKVFSVKTQGEIIPAYPYPAFNFSDKISGYYERHGFCELGRVIDWSKEVYHENNQSKVLSDYLVNGQNIHSIFLPGKFSTAKESPLGYNCLTQENYLGQQVIYINDIKNLKRNIYRGIGRASIAQAANYFFELYPSAPDDALALRIVPRVDETFQENIERYSAYGFTMLNSLTMGMNVALTRAFLTNYYDWIYQNN